MSSRSSSSSGRPLHPPAGQVFFAVFLFFFATTWTIYVLYLPQLAANAGIDKHLVPWILVADQAVFAVMDVVTGFWIDRVRRRLARYGEWILAVTVASCVAFAFLPFVGSTLMLVLLAVWAITSSALRSPPWALLGGERSAEEVIAQI